MCTVYIRPLWGVHATRTLFLQKNFHKKSKIDVWAIDMYKGYRHLYTEAGKKIN